jgi:hypothetical protein
MEKANNSDTSVDYDVAHKQREIEVGEGVTASPAGTNTPSEFSTPPQFDAARTKKLLRKLDWHLVPFLSLLYL